MRRKVAAFLGLVPVRVCAHGRAAAAAPLVYVLMLWVVVGKGARGAGGSGAVLVKIADLVLKAGAFTGDCLASLLNEWSAWRPCWMSGGGRVGMRWEDRRC
eukprot:359872-Chlamydomonas_euryale.AAC.1